MKKISFRLIAFAFLFVLCSFVKDTPKNTITVSPKGSILWWGSYYDGSTAVNIWVNQTTGQVVGAKLNSATTPYITGASGTLTGTGGSNQGVSGFYWVYGGHTYSYSGLLTQ